MVMTSVGERIKQAAQAAGVSLAGLGRAIGITPQELNKLTNNKVKRSKYYPALAKELGVSVEWLTTGAPVKAPEWAAPQIQDPGVHYTFKAIDAQLANVLQELELGQQAAAVERLHAVRSILQAVTKVDPVPKQVPPPVQHPPQT